MTFKRVEEICARFKEKRILVFGDAILDRYIFGEVNRISPEAPVPVVKVTKEEFRAGGAVNVAANIDGLGAAGIITGISGDDIFAQELLKLKPMNNFVIKSTQNKTLVKTRVIANRQQIVRIDREEQIRVTPEIKDRFIKVVDQIKKGGIDGIIISDYAKGSLTEEIMEILTREAGMLHVPVVVDPKPPNFHLYKNIDGITPNLKEANRIVNKKISDDRAAAKAVEWINNAFNTRFSIITRGADGITAGERGENVFHLPAFSHEVFDVTGAGDTVVSVLLLSLVSGATLKEAAGLSNAAASVVIEKIGTSVMTTAEMCVRMKFLLKK